MRGDDTTRFYASLIRYCLVFLVIAAVMFAVPAFLLIWKPELCWELFRFSAAAVCIIVALWLLIVLIRMALSMKR